MKAEKLFEEWWGKTGDKQTTKIQKKWIKENPPNPPDEEEGGDDWFVNRMMHEEDPHEITYEMAQEAFLKGFNGEDWEPDQSNSLYCDLDSVIESAHKAGKTSNKKKEKK